MKKNIVLWISLIVVLWAPKPAAGAGAGAFRIEIHEKKAVRETEIIPLVMGNTGDKKRIKVRVHTTKDVWAKEKTPDVPDVFDRELGTWESELIVFPREIKLYPVDFIMSLQLPGGTVKRVERHLEIDPAESLAPETGTLASLRNDFVDLVRNQYWPVDEKLSAQFEQVLVQFSSKHIRKIIADLPSALQKQDDETTRRAQWIEARQTALNSSEREIEESVRGKFLSVLKEDATAEEDTNFVQVEEAGHWWVTPQYVRRIHFVLTALAQNRVEHYRIAEVTYHAKTLQFPDGKFRTNFRLDIHYMMRQKFSTSRNFEHTGTLNEKEFLENWKNVFWAKASSKVINAGKEESDKTERAYFVSLLEPYIFQEQYGFPEFLTKAKLAFQSVPVQKELKKLQKEHG